jgi:hypothetical protein
MSGHNTACSNDSIGGVNGSSEGSGVTVVVPVPTPVPAPTASITCNPSSVIDGDPSVISWSCGNSDSSSGGGFGTHGTLSGSISVFPFTDTTYSVTCTAGGGSRTATGSCVVDVTAAADDIFFDEILNDGGDGNGDNLSGGGGTWSYSRIECFPRNITKGESVRLRWNCKDSAVSSVRDVAWGTYLHNGEPAFGTEIVQPSDTNEYQLTCGGSGFTASCAVNVFANPFANISAEPILVAKGGESRVTWSSVGATNCSIDGPGLSSVEFAGSQLVTILEKSVFKIECDDGLNDYVTVRILPIWNEQ